VSKQQDSDRARDRQAAIAGGNTLRYGWRETRYEACDTAAEVTWMLWRRGWRGRPKPGCPGCPGCPMAKLLGRLDNWLADDAARGRQWERRREEQEAAQRLVAERLAAEQEAMHRTVEHLARARRAARGGRAGADRERMTGAG